MIVFAILEPGKSQELGGEGDGSGIAGEEKGNGKEEGVNAIAVCLFIGALSSIGAAYATRRLKFVR